MPIFHHKKTHGRFFFIHIPRAAGRFLGENFLENGYGIEHHLTEEMVEEQEMPRYLWTPAEGVEIPHTHYSLYRKWKSIKSLSSIAIVRNPIDRFFSASFSFSKSLNQSSLENWTTYKNILSKYISTNVCNWWRPQHEFVSPNTKIWK